MIDQFNIISRSHISTCKHLIVHIACNRNCVRILDALETGHQQPQCWPTVNYSSIRCQVCCHYYNDVIMSAIVSQITSITIVYSSVCSGGDQRKHQSSLPMAFVCGEFTGDRFVLQSVLWLRKMWRCFWVFESIYFEKTNRDLILVLPIRDSYRSRYIMIFSLGIAGNQSQIDCRLQDPFYW